MKFSIPDIPFTPVSFLGIASHLWFCNVSTYLSRSACGIAYVFIILYLYCSICRFNCCYNFLPCTGKNKSMETIAQTVPLLYCLQYISKCCLFIYRIRFSKIDDFSIFFTMHSLYKPHSNATTLHYISYLITRLPLNFNAYLFQNRCRYLFSFYIVYSLHHQIVCTLHFECNFRNSPSALI